MGFGPPPTPAPPPAPDPGLVLLATIGEQASAADIDLVNLDTTLFDVLKLYFFTLGTVNAAFLRMQFNGDASLAYETERLHWTVGGVAQVQFLAEASIRLQFGMPEFTSFPGAGELDIFQRSGDNAKYVMGNLGHLGSTSGNLAGYTAIGRWLNPARINRIRIFPDGGVFTQPRAWLYGLKRA